jgi:hypothetical protein
VNDPITRIRFFQKEKQWDHDAGMNRAMFTISAYERAKRFIYALRYRFTSEAWAQFAKPKEFSWPFSATAASMSLSYSADFILGLFLLEALFQIAYRVISTVEQCGLVLFVFDIRFARLPDLFRLSSRFVPLNYLIFSESKFWAVLKSLQLGSKANPPGRACAPESGPKRLF